MKNCIILLLAVTLCTAHAQAQENVSVGPIVGVSVANFRGDVANTFVDWKPGITVGGFYNYSSKTGFGFSGQVLFTQMGAKTFNKANEVNLNYIQVPILATFFFGQYGDRLRPKLFAGPNVDFLVGAKDINGDNINGPKDNRIFSPVDLGLTFGAGLNYQIWNKIWLNFDVRYGLGLFNVLRNDNMKLKNSNWGANLGISFPLGTYNKETGKFKTR